MFLISGCVYWYSNKKLASITTYYKLSIIFMRMVMANYVAGIDFGTSNSSAAITNGNTPGKS